MYWMHIGTMYASPVPACVDDGPPGQPTVLELLTIVDVRPLPYEVQMYLLEFGKRHYGS